METPTLFCRALANPSRQGHPLQDTQISIVLEIGRIANLFRSPLYPESIVTGHIIFSIGTLVNPLNLRDSSLPKQPVIIVGTQDCNLLAFTAAPIIPTSGTDIEELSDIARSLAHLLHLEQRFDFVD